MHDQLLHPRAGRRLLCVAALLALAGCAGELGTDGEPAWPAPDAGVPEEPGDELGVSSEALSGNIRFTGQCSPFTIATSERAAFYARVLASSTAFQGCVANSMRAHYWDCEVDPLSEGTMDQQIARVREMLTRFDNDLEIRCAPDAPNPFAQYQGHRTQDEHWMTLNGGFAESNGDWQARYGITAESHVNEPWAFLAGTVLHEFAHTHDYGHPSLDCYAPGDDGDADGDGLVGCDDPDCAWTGACGTPRPPPRGMTMANAGQAERNLCSYLRTGRDDRYATTFGRLDPSVPYIISECAYAVLAESAAQCGQASRGCGDGQLRIIGDWAGAMTNSGRWTRQPAHSCVCEQDSRHLVAFRTEGSAYLTATGGGGSNLSTRAATTRGQWQSFYVHDMNAGEWRSGDEVRVKSSAGQWVGESFRATRTTPSPYPMSFHEQLGRRLGTYSFVSWRAHAYSLLHLTPQERWAYDDGVELGHRSTGGFTGPYTMMIEEYRRDRAVYLEHARTDFFVDVSPTRQVWRGGEGWVLRDRRASYANVKRGSGFRLIDHNGGEVQDGDEISLETMSGDGWWYLSARHAPGGRLSVYHSIGGEERFRVRVLARSPSGLSITLRAHNGRYLTFVGTGRSAEVHSSGTTEGAAQRITLWYVDQYDFVRPTWQ